MTITLFEASKLKSTVMRLAPAGSPAADAAARRLLRPALPTSARARRQSGQKKAPRGTARSPAQYVCIARSQPTRDATGHVDKRSQAGQDGLGRCS